MDNSRVAIINKFINEAYDCLGFQEFLKLAILKLHELVIYDSGMFFCAISKDCSFFKPYLGGDIDTYYQKMRFNERDSFQNTGESFSPGKEAYVYKAEDYAHGLINIDNEPRREFLLDQNCFHIICVRIIYKGEFLGEIYLHRSKERPDFNEEDLFTLRLLQPHISTLFNIIHTVTAVKYTENFEQVGSQKGICMLDRELSLIGGSIAGIEMLKMSTDYGSSVLYHVKEHCMELIDEDTYCSKDKAVFRSFTLKVHNNDICVDIYAKNINTRNNSGRLVVTIEFLNETQTFADYKFKFSKREAELIDGLIQGKNNIQLADSFNLSENTIKTHIKNIYRKTGTNNRTELAYVLMLNK